METKGQRASLVWKQPVIVSLHAYRATRLFFSNKTDRISSQITLTVRFFYSLCNVAFTLYIKGISGMDLVLPTRHYDDSANRQRVCVLVWNGNVLDLLPLPPAPPQQSGSIKQGNLLLTSWLGTTYLVQNRSSQRALQHILAATLPKQPPLHCSCPSFELPLSIEFWLYWKEGNALMFTQRRR